MGSSVSLRDFQALEEAAETGASHTDSLNYQITGKRLYTWRGAGDAVIAEYVLFDIADSLKTYVLAAVLTGEELELRVYFVPDGFQPGTRAELLDHGFEWLFAAPPNPDSFIPYELEYARYPDVPPIHDGDSERQLTFAGSAGGPLYGDYFDQQARRHIPALSIEWRAEQQCSNPLLLVLEEGGLDANGDPVEDGGFVTLLLGSSIDLTQMDVYAI